LAKRSEVSRELGRAIQTISRARDEVNFRYREIEILREIDSFILASDDEADLLAPDAVTKLFRRVIKYLNSRLITGGSCAFYVNLDDGFALLDKDQTQKFPALIDCDASSVDWKSVEASPLHVKPGGEPFTSVFSKATTVYTEPLFIFDDILLGVFVVQSFDAEVGSSESWLSDREHVETLRGVFRQLKVAYRFLVEHRRSAALNDLWGEFANRGFSPRICLSLLATRLVEMLPELGPMKFEPKPQVQILFPYDDTLRILATTGKERDTQSVKVDNSISGLSFKSEALLNIDPTNAEYTPLYQAYFRSGPMIRSELVLPMFAQGEAVGVANFESTQVNAFKQSQARTLHEIVQKITPVALSLKARLDHNREAQSAYSSIMAEYLRKFSGVLHHELASPTAALKVNLGNTKKRLEQASVKNAGIDKELALAEENYASMSTSVFDFIGDLSAYGVVGPICVNGLVEETIEIINDTSRPKISEEDGTLDEHEFRILYSASRRFKVNASRLLKPYLVCLFDNSIRSIKAKRKSGMLKQRGKIVVRIEQDEQHSNHVAITIKDNGGGVGAKELSQLKRFKVGTRFRRDNGHGYGLAATQRYLAEIGGWIDIDSSKGKSFTVRLSLRQEDM